MGGRRMEAVRDIVFRDHHVGSDKIIARGRQVIGIEAEALAALEAALDENFIAACREIFAARRQLVVTGMGKSGHISRKIAATFAATGTPAIFIHPAESAHGDLGMLVAGDVLLVLSNSGNTSELRAILTYARSLGVRIIGIASHRNSFLIENADIGICLPHRREACSANAAPTTSTTMQLALGDALAMAVMDMRGINKDSLRLLHPAGAVGMKLTPISEIMHGKNDMPLARADALMPEVISTMTCGRFGIAGVIDGIGNLAGIITDGDLRRHFDILDCATAAEIMTSSPKTIPSDTLAADALFYMNEHNITAAFVVGRDESDQPQRPVGIVHIHDLLRLGLS